MRVGGCHRPPNTHAGRRLSAGFALAIAAVLVTGGPVEAARAWSIVSSPSIGTVGGVSCTSAGFCMAVATGGIAEWDGTSWGIVSSPNIGRVGGVSCTSARFCMAVGSGGIEEWDGTSWGIVSSPNIGRVGGVSCTSASFCMAAGSDTNGSDVTRTLIEEWDGVSWSIVSSPNPSTTFNYLRAVSCSNANFCMAAGYFADTNVEVQILIEEWDGTSWSIVSPPNNNILDSVSCSSASFCMAVGNYPDGMPLIEQWDGTSWSGGEQPGSTYNLLYSVSCSSANFCMAAGFYTRGSGYAYQTLIEEWDGTSWSIISSPNTSSTTDNHLGAVSCSSASFCMAAGDSSNGSTGRTLIEEWDHRSTSHVSTTPASNSITLSQSNTDAATVTGDAASGSPTGTVTFFACGPLTTAGGCANDGAVVGTVDLTSGANSTATATSDAFTPNASGTWCFRGYYSGDANYGASSDSSAAECFAVTTTFQDTSTSVGYGDWRGVSDRSASGGTYRTASVNGANAAFTFSGTGITWVTRKGPEQGIACVTIDGKTKGSVDLYAPTRQELSQGYSGLASKSHTIVITVTGSKDTSSSGTNVAVDAFIVGFTTTEDSSNKVAFANWAGAKSTSASGGTYRVSQTAGATSKLSFTGAGVDWITATGPSAGMASVTIDGVSRGTIDLYTPTVHWQVPESYRGLTSGSHTIIVKVLGTENAASTGTAIVVDAFVLHS